MQRQQIDHVLLVIDDKNFRARHGQLRGPTKLRKANARLSKMRHDTRTKVVADQNRKRLYSACVPIQNHATISRSRIKAASSVSSPAESFSTAFFISARLITDCIADAISTQSQEREQVTAAAT